jgi:hypothetical protein
MSNSAAALLADHFCDLISVLDGQKMVRFVGCMQERVMM